jgi:hypothetical protein
MEKTDITPEQTCWIKENYKQVKIIEIADRYGVSEYRAKVWLNQLGLKKPNRVYTRNKKEKKNQAQIEVRKRKWIPGSYSNVTREQHIDRILSMNV